MRRVGRCKTCGGKVRWVKMTRRWGHIDRWKDDQHVIEVAEDAGQ